MNLLDNWDFTNPVNQRGITVGTKHIGIEYFLDRWINANSTGYKITTQGLQLYANSDIYQIIDKNLLGQNVTLSIRLSNNSIISASFEAFSSVPTNNSFKAKTINNIELIFGVLTDGNFQVSIKPQVNILITAVKLELGKVSTLKNDLLGVSYAEELRKCQRYYQRLTSKNTHTTLDVSAMFSTVDIFFNLTIPVPMRTKPVVSVNGLAFIQDVTNSVESEIDSISADNVVSELENGISIKLHGVLKTPVNKGDSCLVNLRNGSYIELSADL